jgi:hypothetical protein
MKNVMTLLIALVCFITNSFGQSTREFTLSNFDKVDLGSAFKIEIRPGNYKILAAGNKEDLDELEGNVRSGTLVIKYKDSKGWSWNKNRKTVSLVILMPQLKGLDLSGATTTTVEGFKNVEKMDLDISGASRLTAAFTAKKVSLDISGASTIILEGKAEQMSGDISGATTFRATKFEVENASLDISGASSAKLNISQNLKASASGASSIRYTGNPQNVTKDISGASSIRKDD